MHWKGKIKRYFDGALKIRCFDTARKEIVKERIKKILNISRLCDHTADSIAELFVSYITPTNVAVKRGRNNVWNLFDWLFDSSKANSQFEKNIEIQKGLYDQYMKNLEGLDKGIGDPEGFVNKIAHNIRKVLINSSSAIK
ncbi:MAG: hypothetical protein ACR5KV_01455 [Wolbachia sp.]